MSGLVIGLDGGGTQTRAAAGDTAGAVHGSGRAGACNLAAVLPAEALAVALSAIDGALAEAGGTRGDVTALCAAVAGVSFGDRRQQFLNSLQAAFPQAEVSVVPDYAAALTGATGGEPGVIVIAGTGSAAYGENAAGKTHRTGAYGYLIDDAGSGYGLGRAALAAALRGRDGTGEATTLGSRLCAALGLSSLDDIVPGIYGGTLSRVAVASLSRMVAAAATEDGDPVAEALLMRAGGALAVLVRGVTERLFAGAEAPYPVCRVGGLWEAGGVLEDVFTRSVRRFAPAAALSPPAEPPVQGAVRRARALLRAKEDQK